MNGAVVLVCPSCLSRNRVPRDRFADVPVCATCRTRLLPDHPIALDDASFDRFVAGSELPVLVDFWAAWCGPCRMMAPHFDAAARSLRGRAILAKVDTEAAPGTAARFTVRSIPTLVLLRGGVEAARQSGALMQDAIERWVAAAGV